MDTKEVQSPLSQRIKLVLGYYDNVIFAYSNIEKYCKSFFELYDINKKYNEEIERQKNVFNGTKGVILAIISLILSLILFIPVLLIVKNEGVYVLASMFFALIAFCVYRFCYDKWICPKRIADIKQKEEKNECSLAELYYKVEEWADKYEQLTKGIDERCLSVLSFYLIRHSTEELADKDTLDSVKKGINYFIARYQNIMEDDKGRYGDLKASLIKSLKDTENLEIKIKETKEKYCSQKEGL